MSDDKIEKIPMVNFDNTFQIEGSIKPEDYEYDMKNIQSFEKKQVESKQDQSVTKVAREIDFSDDSDAIISNNTKVAKEIIVESPTFPDLKEALEKKEDVEKQKETDSKIGEIVSDTKNDPIDEELKCVNGVTNEEAIGKIKKDNDDIEKNIPVSKSPITYSSIEEIDDLMRFSQTHYKIINGEDRTKLKKPLIVDTSNIKIVNVADDPKFEFRKLKIEDNFKKSTRKVQIVCTQSGYSVMCTPMNSRELRSFGRDDRSNAPNTYNYEMAICEAIYNKLCNFSIGQISFDDWMKVTAFPDLQTCIFGVYKATYPTVNYFNVPCDFCSENFSIPITNDALVCIPTGSLTPESINKVINGEKDPRTLVKESKRYTARRIYMDDNKKFFDFGTPSIMEFLEKAYKGKSESFIELGGEDMYYSAYIRGFGVLDIDKYNETGEAEWLYIKETREIDREIANLSPDDKQKFERQLIDYINLHSVSYQIPRLRCPHCHKIMTQKELNMKTLFFETRAQKGL